MDTKKLEGAEYAEFIRTWILNNSAYKLEYNVRSCIEQFCDLLEKEEGQRSSIKEILQRLNPHPLDKTVSVGKNFTKKDLCDSLHTVLAN